MTLSSDAASQLPASVVEALCHPFSPQDVQLRPGRVQQKQPEGSWFCLAIPYVSRQVYETRLNQVLPGAWSSFCPSLVVADNYLTLSAQVMIGPITHTSYCDMRLPRLDLPDDLGMMTGSCPEAYAVAFIDACQRFGLGQYLTQFARKWVPYDSERQQIALSREEQHDLVLALYQQASLPLDLPTAGGSAVKKSHPVPEAEGPGTLTQSLHTASLGDARTRLRERDLKWVREQCSGKPLHNILANYHLKRLEEINDDDLAAVIRGIRKRQAS